LVFVISVFTILLLNSVASAGNIDPYEDDSQYAYGENVGWLNFEPNIADPTIAAAVTSEKLTGFVWAENIGWINLSPETYGGVVNDGAGNLSGYAWGENVGWINFNTSYGGVTIDADGSFDGWAWGENIGWVNFQSSDLYGYNVMACKVNLEDLANFVAEWLLTGELDADLSGNDEVDLVDYGILVDYWLDYCPDDWPLKTAGL